MAESELRVGVYQADNLPQSFQVYSANVRKHFQTLGIVAIPFKNDKELPKTADLLWDVRSGGGIPPLEFMLGRQPLVITVHGFAPISLSGWEYFHTLKDTLLSPYYTRQKLVKWRQYKDAVAALIAVSAFSKSEAVRLTGLPPERIAVCHNGVDMESFYPSEVHSQIAPYFLHVSNDEPRKNVGRIIRAFQRLRKSHNVELVLKLPESQARHYQGIEGVRVISGMLSTERLADLYRGALAFLFPSLYEGFGIPIVEAMACGCPVITSNVSACPEVAGDAALIVDPREENGLLQAMSSIICQDKAARARLVEAGLQRARFFTWLDSSIRHAEVLRAVANGGPLPADGC